MSSAPSFVTPLRYPGGKARLGAWLAQVIRANGLEGGNYVEPYAGGAGAAVYLLVNGLVNDIYINDADPAIYAFWWALTNDTEQLISLIREKTVTMETWEEQREILSESDMQNKTALGFSAFFLNRTNRSGIIKGGVIGGKKQSGKYKIDARYNKETLTNRIQVLAKHSDRIHVSNLDAWIL